MDLRQTFGLIYSAVAIHSVQTQVKLLARFSGPREDVEWTARGLMYGIPCFFVLSASWCGNGALGNRLCWVRSGIAFFSSTSSTLGFNAFVPPKSDSAKHALRRQLAMQPSMDAFVQSVRVAEGFLSAAQVGKKHDKNLNSHNALMHKLGKTMLCGALSAKWLQLKHSGVGRDLPLVRQLPGTLNILVPRK